MTEDGLFKKLKYWGYDVLTLTGIVVAADTLVKAGGYGLKRAHIKIRDYLQRKKEYEQKREESLTKLNTLLEKLEKYFQTRQNQLERPYQPE